MPTQIGPRGEIQSDAPGGIMHSRTLKPKTTHKVRSIMDELNAEREVHLLSQRRDQDDYRHYLDEQILEKKQRK